MSTGEIQREKGKKEEKGTKRGKERERKRERERQRTNERERKTRIGETPSVSNNSRVLKVLGSNRVVGSEVESLTCTYV